MTRIFNISPLSSKKLRTKLCVKLGGFWQTEVHLSSETKRWVGLHEFLGVQRGWGKEIDLVNFFLLVDAELAGAHIHEKEETTAATKC